MGSWAASRCASTSSSESSSSRCTRPPGPGSRRRSPVLGRDLAIAREMGYVTDEPVCLVTVGGSGLGGALLEQVMAAHPMARRHVPDLRMVVVTGPRIDPDSLPTHEGLDVRAFVPQLYRHLAACDLALVQGGLTTGMELTATRRPFLYFPLGHHLVQSFHVHHRLRRYRAGRRVDFASTDPDGIAEAIATELSRPVDYRTDESDGAARGRPRGRARLSPASTPGGSSWPNHLTSPHSPAGH